MISKLKELFLGKKPPEKRDRSTLLGLMQYVGYKDDLLADLCKGNQTEEKNLEINLIKSLDAFKKISGPIVVFQQDNDCTLGFQVASLLREKHVFFENFSDPKDEIYMKAYHIKKAKDRIFVVNIRNDNKQNLPEKYCSISKTTDSIKSDFQIFDMCSIDNVREVSNILENKCKDVIAFRKSNSICDLSFNGFKKIFVVPKQKPSRAHEYTMEEIMEIITNLQSKGNSVNFEHIRSALKIVVDNLGTFDMPGLSSFKPEDMKKIKIEIKKILSVTDSMTVKERIQYRLLNVSAHPGLRVISPQNNSRIQRISKGCGRSPEEVSEILKKIILLLENAKQNPKAMQQYLHQVTKDIPNFETLLK